MGYNETDAEDSGRYQALNRRDGPAAEPEEKMTTAPEAAARPGRPITFTVDGEPVTTTEEHLTANQILSLAGIDPATNYLVRVSGREQESYQGRGSEEIRVHEHEVFVSVSTGPTPVS
jgi:hypothetical protein